MVSLQDTKRIEGLMKLFKGSENAHGIFIEASNVDPLKPKVKGKAMTSPKGPTFSNWSDHYFGKVGLGVVPINSEDMCYWGVLDVDGELDSNRQPLHSWECLNKDGSINHIILQQEIAKQNLPLTCCFSKSKSAHCFLFTDTPIPAQAMRSLLEEMASRLGVGGCEIFPKQDKLDKERGDLGNWLNMPFFGNTRKGIKLVDGSIVEVEVDEFIEMAKANMLDKSSLDVLAGNMRENIDALEDVLVGAPPCLQHILQRGIPVGSRNSILFNVAVYCHRRYGDDFRTEFGKLHDQFVDDPLGFKELETICVSAEKKEYQYQCKDPLLKKYCNANICMDRDCGIDFSTEIKTLKSATRILTDPVVYAVEVEMGAGLPHTVYVETDALFSQDVFRKECSLQLHKTFVPISGKAWNDICVRLINTAINQEPPYEMSESGQLMRFLTDYLVNRAQNKRTIMTEEEGVFHDIDEHLVYFRLDGFKGFLVRKGYIAQSYSKWKLNKKLEDIVVPTDEVNLDTGTSIKQKINMEERQIRVGNNARIRVRCLPDSYLQLEEISTAVEEGEVV